MTTEPITVTENGDETHPAFGGIDVGFISTTPSATLFGSDVQHSDIVRLTISTMSRTRSLGTDRHYPEQRLIEVDMSQAQWAAIVSGGGRGTKPCTLRYTKEQGSIPGLEFHSRLATSAQEVRDAAQKSLAKVEAAYQALEDLGEKAGVKARREAMRQLRLAIEGAPRNMQFAADSLTAHVEDVVTKARADIEVATSRGIATSPVEVTLPALEGTDTSVDGSDEDVVDAEVVE